MLELKIIHSTIENGGLTYNPMMNIDLAGQKYFAVAMYPDREKILTLNEFTVETVRDYLLDNRDLLKDQRNSLGTWLDTETQKIYLDISRTITDKETALKLAKNNNQLAIFDLKNLTEIRL